MKKAFTLIELLIVIAILAILAIGVLAAIDPIEQFRRGADSTVINTASEYKNAIDRFYAGQSRFPQGITSGMTWGNLTAGAASSSITDMITAGELKSSFTSGAGTALSNIYVNWPAGANGPIVCATLQSKTFRNNSAATFNLSGTAQAGGCPSCPCATGATCSICYF